MWSVVSLDPGWDFVACQLPLTNMIAAERVVLRESGYSEMDVVIECSGSGNDAPRRLYIARPLPVITLAVAGLASP